MKIVWCSRPAAEKLKPHDGDAIISIYDELDGEAHLPLFKHICRLSFADADSGPYTLFSAEHAGIILSFYSEWDPRLRDTNTLYVHCQAGQSRSAAVALALGELYDEPTFRLMGPPNTGELRHHSPGDYPLYNRLVFRKLIEAGGCDRLYMQSA